jgi:serine/threonine protein kinase
LQSSVRRRPVSTPPTGRGLVHHDVKPGNILIGEDDHVYVADFGLTKQASSQTGLTATGQLVGTLDYVAPEQIQGQPVDGRTDEYSLACVLFECLAGARPFERDTEVAVLWAHMQDPPPTLSERRADRHRTDRRADRGRSGVDSGRCRRGLRLGREAERR